MGGHQGEGTGDGEGKGREAGGGRGREMGGSQGGGRGKGKRQGREGRSGKGCKRENDSLDIFPLVFLCDLDVIATWFQLILMYFSERVVLYRESVVQNILNVVLPVINRKEEEKKHTSDTGEICVHIEDMFDQPRPLAVFFT